MAQAGVGWFTRQVFTRTALDQLPSQLQWQYGIDVTGVTELDVGVYRVRHADGPDWAARVFPAARPAAAAEGDVAVLRALAQGGFPAERCTADSPVSSLDGQAVPVTEFVAETGRGGTGGRTPSWGRCWADCTPEAGKVCRLAVAGTTWPWRERRPMRWRWRGRCWVNLELLLSRARAPGVVAGVCAVGGRGPDLRLVDAFVSRYRRHVSLEDAELATLPAAIGARPLTMGIWSLAVGRGDVTRAVQDHRAIARQAQEIASRARQAIDAD